MSVRVFDQSMAVTKDTASRDFLEWLRTLVDQSNYALTFAAVKAALALADSSVGFNNQDMTNVNDLSASGNLISTAAGAIDAFSVWRANGSQDITIRDSGDGGGATFSWQGRSRIGSPSDGVFELWNNAKSAYARTKVGTPTQVDDAVTKAYADALGGGASIAQVEVDLGSTPKRSGKFTITDAGIASTSKVVCVQAGGPYTGKGTLGDEAEMDHVDVAVTPATGSATAYWNSRTLVRGNFKFNYQVAA